MTGHDWHYVDEHEGLAKGDWVRSTRQPGARFKVHAIALNQWGEVKWVKVYGGPKEQEEYRYLQPRWLRKTSPPVERKAS